MTISQNLPEQFIDISEYDQQAHLLPQEDEEVADAAMVQFENNVANFLPGLRVFIDLLQNGQLQIPQEALDMFR